MTDWDAYYAHPFPLSKLTRAYTARRLARLMRIYTDPARPMVVAELGGGNSAFLNPLTTRLPISRFVAIDRNERSLLPLLNRITPKTAISVICGDARVAVPELQADVVFSVGLIEHFGDGDIQNLLRAHFRCARPGGIVIISFPTPTGLYRSARYAAELLGKWRFFDERPLASNDIARRASEYGTILHRETLWPLIFTQSLIVFRNGRPDRLQAERSLS